MPRRLIIDIVDDDISEVDALDMVTHVVTQGYISQAAGRPHYCWVTRFTGGALVVTRRKKPNQASDSFKVFHGVRYA